MEMSGLNLPGVKTANGTQYSNLHTVFTVYCLEIVQMKWEARRRRGKCLPASCSQSLISRNVLPPQRRDPGSDFHVLMWNVLMRTSPVKYSRLVLKYGSWMECVEAKRVTNKTCYISFFTQYATHPKMITPVMNVFAGKAGLTQILLKHHIPLHKSRQIHRHWSDSYRLEWYSVCLLFVCR